MRPLDGTEYAEASFQICFEIDTPFETFIEHLEDASVDDFATRVARAADALRVHGAELDVEMGWLEYPHQYLFPNGVGEPGPLRGVGWLLSAERLSPNRFDAEWEFDDEARMIIIDIFEGGQFQPRVSVCGVDQNYRRTAPPDSQCCELARILTGDITGWVDIESASRAGLQWEEYLYQLLLEEHDPEKLPALRHVHPTSVAREMIRAVRDVR